MGDIDIAAKAFFRDPRNFADLFNFKLFDGRPVISPDQLTEVDVTETLTLGKNSWQDTTGSANGTATEKGVRSRKRTGMEPSGKRLTDRKAGIRKNARLFWQRFRDNARAWNWNTMHDGKRLYVLLGIESQTQVHYAVPVRCLVSDAMSYDRQLEDIRNCYRDHSRVGNPLKMTHAEFVSGIRRADKLMPVITIVFYLGADPWDGPNSLHEMLGIQDPEILAWVPDYTINLVQPSEINEDDLPKFHSELGQVLQYLHYSKDREKLYKITEEGDRFKALSPQCADLINIATGSKLEIREEERKEGKINMRNALDEIREEGEAIGEAKGASVTLENCTISVMKTLKVPVDAAMDVLQVDPQQREDLARRVKRRLKQSRSGSGPLSALAKPLAGIRKAGNRRKP